MEKKRTNSGPFMESTSKHSIYTSTNRRLAKDYERLVETGEMLLYLAMCRILLRRLTRKGER